MAKQIYGERMTTLERRTLFQLADDGSTPARIGAETSAAENDAPGMANLLTTHEVAACLGVACSTIRLRVKERHLHPVKVAGKLRFHPNEVAEEAARVQAERDLRRGALTRGPPPRSPSQPRTGIRTSSMIEDDVSDREPIPPPPAACDAALCARSVEIFRAGKGQLDAVVEMRVDFEAARYLWHAYVRAQPGWFMTPRTFAQVRSLVAWSEDPPTSAGFLRALRAYINREVEQAVRVEIEKLAGAELTGEEREEAAQIDRDTLAGEALDADAPECGGKEDRTSRRSGVS